MLCLTLDGEQAHIHRCTLDNTELLAGYIYYTEISISPKYVHNMLLYASLSRFIPFLMMLACCIDVDGRSARIRKSAN
jgi:hypothetical protein